jgi:hypothetical protein
MAEEEVENIFEDSNDYTHKGETYKRDNYKAWALTLEQDRMFAILADNCKASELKLSNWEKESLAEWMTTIHYGKEKD